MCSLCSALGGSRYWTDAAGQGAFEKSSRRLSLITERRRRVALLNVVFEPYHLSISDWGGSSYVVENQSGRTQNVYSLAGIWAEADLLADRLCDPLDPLVIARLNGDSMLDR